MIFRCKICGGSLEIADGTRIYECEYCGTKQSLPKLESEKRANLYDRANHFRRNNEFDKATAIYDQILNEDNTDAEAYWSLVLCRYGVTYVEDYATKKRVPTVNRAQYTSIFDDDNYKAALQHADDSQKALYESEAKAINEIQKGILDISQNEKPFDIFICYKETDSNGRRTPDSVLAQDLYQQLTQDGFKVFFSRITLEDKLGSAYEPYIFAALNSAKIMVVIGTKPEHFNAVWVKNEWSRYLTLIKSGAKKVLIPAYKDMDPYDLPDEFSHLQAQDMSKLGFMQDLVRGIKKIIGVNEAPVQRAADTAAPMNIDALLKRAFIFIEDRNKKDADSYFEKVLDGDPENAKAYLGKMMVQLNVTKQEELAGLDKPLEECVYYEKAVRYADASLKEALQGYNTSIKKKLESTRLEEAYKKAVKKMRDTFDDEAYQKAVEKFEEISKDSPFPELAAECYEDAKAAYNEEVYQSACKKAEKTGGIHSKLSAFEEAVTEFGRISEYKDSEDKMLQLKAEIEKLKEQRTQKNKKNTKLTGIIAAAAAGVAVFVVLLINVIIPAVKYSTANRYVENARYTEAIEIYKGLEDYKDSKGKVKEATYLLGLSYLESGKYNDASKIFDQLGEYKKAKEKLQEANYNQGLAYEKEKNYKDAYKAFSKATDYKDGKAKQQENGYKYAQALAKEKKYTDAIDVLDYIGKYDKAKGLKNECYLNLAKQYYAEKDYKNALSNYESMDSYDKYSELYINICCDYATKHADAKNFSKALDILKKINKTTKGTEHIKYIKYRYVKSNKDNDNETTFKYLKELKAAGYKDSASIYSELYDWKITLECANTDVDDFDTILSSVRRSVSYFHYGLRLTGGTPGEKATFYHVTTWPNGTTNTADWTWDNESDEGYLGCEWGDGFNLNKSGTMIVDIYNQDTGKHVGSVSFTIKG